MDKTRGFVNGAYAEGVESLDGDRVFTARLLSSGNVVLIHPLEEEGSRFLPCCYGYATTIRRAQGCGFHHGCIYFDLKKYPAARGYAYVAVSRFVSRSGCYLYGKLRRSDFLPVGEDKEEEILERGWDSETSSDNSEHGMQYIGGFARTEDDSNVSSGGEESDVSFGARCGVMNTLAGGMSEEDGNVAEAALDFV